jgi:hypothetical protein
MDQDEALELIRSLNDEHRNDRDGGYALVHAIKLVHGQIEPDARVSFASALADLVRAQDQQLWGVALEALVQVGANQELAALGEELAGRSHDGQWKDHVVLGLLRLEQRPFRERILEHVHASLGTPRRLTVPIVAALCRIDRDASLELSAEYFADAHRRGLSFEAEAFAPAFVRHFLAVDDQLLASLVHRVTAALPEAGLWLARCFVGYLSKPWMREELGNERSASLGAAITAAAEPGS